MKLTLTCHTNKWLTYFGIKKDELCYVGNYEEVNYMFYYKDRYYDIVEFNKFNIVSCEDLSEMNVTGE